MFSYFKDSTSLEWLSRHTKSLERLDRNTKSRQRTLTPASRFIWIALLNLTSSKSRFVEGSVENVCNRLGLCDKTFKKAVDELKNTNLLKLHKVQTNLGAHSFQYEPTIPPDISLHKTEQTYSNFRNKLLSQKQFDSKRVTVSQRSLMIAVLAVTDGYGLITEFHVNKLSQLTGISNRNILSNLANLEEKGLLTLITEQTGKKTLWAYQLKYFSHISEIKCVFDRNVHSEIQVISLLIRRKEIEEKFQTSTYKLYKSWLIKQFGMKGSKVEFYLYSVFSDVPEDIRTSVLKVIGPCRVNWQKLNNNVLHVYVDWLLQLAAIQTLRYQFKYSNSNMYSNCPPIENLIKTQVSFFPLTSEQRKVLEQILVPLSKMVATAIKNKINDIFPKAELDQCQIFVESSNQWLANHADKTNELRVNNVYILEHEPRYKTKRPFNSLTESDLA